MPSHPESVEDQIPIAGDVALCGSPFGSVKLIVLTSLVTVEKGNPHCPNAVGMHATVATSVKNLIAICVRTIDSFPNRGWPRSRGFQVPRGRAIEPLLAAPERSCTHVYRRKRRDGSAWLRGIDRLRWSWAARNRRTAVCLQRSARSP